MKNKYENLFDSFMDMTEFGLIKHPDGFGVVDWQGANLGNIENDRFKSAEEIFERMDIYIHDYFIVDIEDVLDEKNIEIDWDEDYESYIVHAKDLVPEIAWSFEILDMICHYYEEINLNNCSYTTDETCAKEDK